MAVGWDKRINIYNDAVDEGIHHIQHPLPKWADDVVSTRPRETLRDSWRRFFSGGGGLGLFGGGGRLVGPCFPILNHGQVYI